MKLSRHFIENWEKRVGWDRPTPQGVADLMRQSIKVQPGRRFLLKGGGTYVQLAIYWHPGLHIVLQIDTVHNVAVSLLTRHNYFEKKSGGRHVDKKTGSSAGRG